MKNIVVIAIVGKKRSGKDTVGDYLVENYGVQKAQKLAHPIKEIGKLMFGWSDDMVEGINYDREQIIPELGMSVRQFLQECGSLFKYCLSEALPQYKDTVGEKVWAKILVRWLKENGKDNQIFCVTDVRFPEEVEELKSNFKTYVLKLVSDRSPEDQHVSETSCDKIIPDAVITNNGWDSYSELFENIDMFMRFVNKEIFYEDKSIG
jgi:hypothetical protein